jgi:lipoprotein-anchoring transpeptidase ErfK/SrfK
MIHLFSLLRTIVLGILLLIASAGAREVIPLSKTLFDVISDTGDEARIDLKGRDFIVVSVREQGSDGRFYAVDRDGIVWFTGPITSGANDFPTPSGIYTVLRKKRFHMSQDYPDPSGINNMDYSIFFTPQGHALHKGSVNWMSHGCIHISPIHIPTLFRWARIGYTKVVITRNTYMPMAKPDLIKYNLR